ncbi:MAG: hypothetical protein OXU43_00450 [Gammaproteobacteria bacterium]|nr:hypothetical protein [Gammaproteobacteria bacterium]
MNEYFSDRENGPRPHPKETISPQVCRTIETKIKTLIDQGAFAKEFPERCPDSEVIAGTNTNALITAMVGDIPRLQWENPGDPIFSCDTPEILLILDAIEYVFRHIADPTLNDYHEYYRHQHYIRFDKHKGQSKFLEEINLLFARNNIAYELKNDGKIHRVLPPQLDELIQNTTQTRSGNETLDQMITKACDKIRLPSHETKQEALEKIWKVWERIKTIHNPDKKKAIEEILARAAPEEKFRERLQKEAKELTAIGNAHYIRHSETVQRSLETPEQIDYLFHRMLAMIYLLLQNIRT